MGLKTIRSSPAQTHSHFLWNAKLPNNHCWDIIFFSILNLHGGYIYVWAGLKPDWFHWQATRWPKTIRSSPAQTHSHFLWNAKLLYIHCWGIKFFPNSNLHGGYIYVWAGLKPDWFHWKTSRGPKTIRSSPAQTHSHFLWNAKLPCHSSPIKPMAATFMWDWQASRGFKTSRLAFSDPFPFSMERQTSL